MMDHTGKWILPMNDSNNISDDDDASMMMHQPMVTVITSPGVPSQLLKNIEHGNGNDDGSDDHDDRPPLCLVEVQEEDAPKETILVCQGATLRTTEHHNRDDDDTTRNCLAVCARLSNVLVMEGITTGDVVASASGILSTRHARTLSYLFQSVLSSPVPTETTKPTLVVTVVTTSEEQEEEEDSKNRAWDPEALLQDIRTLFQVVATSSTLQLEDVYNVQIVPISTTQVRLGNLCVRELCFVCVCVVGGSYGMTLFDRIIVSNPLTSTSLKKQSVDSIGCHSSRYHTIRFLLLIIIIFERHAIVVHNP